MTLFRLMFLFVLVPAVVAPASDSDWLKSERAITKILNKRFKKEAKEPLPIDKIIRINEGFRQAGLDTIYPAIDGFVIEKPARIKSLKRPTIPTHFVHYPDRIDILAWVVTNAEGSVEEVLVLKSSDPRFNESVEEALFEWRIIPPIVGGSYVPYGFPVSYRYEYE